MNTYLITFKLKRYLHELLTPIENQEVKADTLLDAIVIFLTKNESVDIPEIIKIELV